MWALGFSPDWIIGLIAVALVLVHAYLFRHKIFIEKEDIYRSLFQKNYFSIFLICPQTGNIVDANSAACNYYGYSKESLLSMNINDINLSITPEMFNEISTDNSKKNKVFNFKHKLASGEIRDVEVYWGSIKYKGEDLIYSMVQDITEKKLADEKIIRMAYHDMLTGLPNRTLCNDYLNNSLINASLNNDMVGILFLDFDRFKCINDTLGHFIGDKLLENITERLKFILDKSDFIARAGGDEFLVILPKVTDKGKIKAIAEKIVSEFRQPIIIDGYELYTTVSLGISVYPFDGTDVRTLMKNAEIAMYKAKDSGRDNYRVFTQSMKNVIYDNFYFANNLRNAIEREELVVYYQPKIDIQEGKVTGVEALIRWDHPELGLIPPAKFISIAEETGLIVPIGEWVLRRACAQNKAWQDAGYKPIKMAVNISARQLQQKDLYEKLVEILKETNLEAKYLELEITESIAIKNIDKTNDMLNNLKELGVNIAMDDFGTGYSALSYLNQISIDILKIDQSFIRNLALSEHNKEIAAFIIKMAHALELKVTAEGVETEEDINFLKRHKCDYVQGYYFSRPIPSDEFEKLFLKS
ncbi:sensor domain-containing protein [Clostridium sp. JNZ J1-5]